MEEQRMLVEPWVVEPLEAALRPCNIVVHKLVHKPSAVVEEVEEVVEVEEVEEVEVEEVEEDYNMLVYRLDNMLGDILEDMVEVLLLGVVLGEEVVEVVHKKEQHKLEEPLAQQHNIQVVEHIVWDMNMLIVVELVA